MPGTAGNTASIRGFTKHVVVPFAIADDWLRFRSMAWGSAKPFSVGWWAVASADHWVGDKLLPRGSTIRYREWYGASRPNVGLKLTAEQVAREIKHLEANDPKISYGVLDPAAFTADGGPSIAEWMAKEDAWFNKADNKRTSKELQHLQRSDPARCRRYSTILRSRRMPTRKRRIMRRMKRDTRASAGRL